MAPRILVLSASVGAGHLRAAEAVELALRETVPDAHVENHDVLEMTNWVFRRVYSKFYLDLVNRAPYLLGYFYDLLDRPASTKQRRDKFRFGLEKLNLKKFHGFLKSTPWDLIINTHFLPAEMLANMRKKKDLAVPQVTVTTDFETHRLWVNQPCDRYFTATEEGARYLQHWGVPAKDTFATGIPVHPVFSRPRDKAELLKKHGLTKDRPVILQLSGGFGVGPVEKLFLALLDVEVPLQVVTITGKNEKLKAKLQALPTPPRHNVKVMGFTTEIDELMAVADLVMTKPGGLTTSETLARDAIMMIVNPIPGQETRNSDFLLESGAAIKINNIGTMPYKLTSLLADKRRLQQLRDNVKRIARPRAAFDVVSKSLELIGKKVE